MTDRELMQQALEALEDVDAVPYERVHVITAALRERLAQPQQEPVAWMYQDKSTHEVRFQKHMRGFVDHGATYETPLYTTPPRHEWVGLTEEEADALRLATGYAAGLDRFTAIARAIEAKLKEKNA